MPSDLPRNPMSCERGPCVCDFIVIVLPLSVEVYDAGIRRCLKKLAAPDR